MIESQLGGITTSLYSFKPYFSKLMKLVPIKANQTELHLNDGTVVLFSYKTPVAGFTPDVGFFRTEEFFSTTTSRHINNYLRGEGLNPEEVEKVPQSQIDTVVDLVN